MHVSLKFLYICKAAINMHLFIYLFYLQDRLLVYVLSLYYTPIFICRQLLRCVALSVQTSNTPPANLLNNLQILQHSSNSQKPLKIFYIPACNKNICYVFRTPWQKRSTWPLILISTISDTSASRQLQGTSKVHW